MNIQEAKKITLSLINTFNKASQVALDLRKVGLTKEIKSDNTPVSNVLDQFMIDTKQKKYLRLLQIFQLFQRKALIMVMKKI